MSEQTASEARENALSFRFFSSGSSKIDSLLHGGFRAGHLTELFGRSGSGKTLLAAQTALLAAKAGKKSLYIDTEGSFRPERLQQLAESRGWGLAGLLENILYVRTDSAAEQLETVRKMRLRPATSSTSLVIVDTLTRNFTVELPGRSNVSNRQAALNVYLSEVARDAYLNGRAYLLANRVTFGTLHDVGIGGRTVEQLVQATVRLERDDRQVKATLARSGESVAVKIGPGGID
jgi:DNA repair protein RadA